MLHKHMEATLAQEYVSCGKELHTISQQMAKSQLAIQVTHNAGVGKVTVAVVDNVSHKHTSWTQWRWLLYEKAHSK